MLYGETVAPKISRTCLVERSKRIPRLSPVLEEHRARRGDQQRVQVKPGQENAGEKVRGTVLAKKIQVFEHGVEIMIEELDGINFSRICSQRRPLSSSISPARTAAPTATTD